MDLLDRLLEHDRWATETLLDVSRNLTDEQFDQQFDIGHRSVRATFEHIIPNVDFWTRLMEGQPLKAPHDGLSLDSLIEDHARNYTAFAALARRVRDDRRLDDIFLDHYDMPQTFGGAILMVILHNAEHRTEVLHILQRLGVPDLPEVDPGLWDFERRGL